MFERGGRLVASTAQEGLIRKLETTDAPLGDRAK
jgi:acyl-CoA thioesterase